MTPRRKRTPEEVKRLREIRAQLAELERIDALSDTELEGELRDAGFELDVEVTVGWLPPPPSEGDKGRARARRRPWPWLAAAGAIVVLILAAMAAR
jgi:hypothetical protein